MTQPEAPRLEGCIVESHIGSGGCADVWRVRRADGTLLAAKVFRPDAASTGRGELRAMRRHAGPHVMPVIDYVTDGDGRGVLLMPYLAGGSLWSLITGRGGLTAGEVVTATTPIAAALTRMHDGGCVHGDVTPRNILLDERGKPVLSDMGATRVAAMPGEAEWGSAGYVAPEVLDGAAPDSCSDVYALGAVMWFALTGEAPGPATLRPRLVDITEDVPPRLAEIVTASLATTPSARPHAADLGAMLAEAARPVPLPLTMGTIPSQGDDTGPAAGQPAGAGQDSTAADVSDIGAESITRRLRTEAQRRQLAEERAAASGRRGRRHTRAVAPSASPSSTRRPARRWLVGAGLCGAGVIAAGALWPAGSDTQSTSAVALHQPGAGGSQESGASPSAAAGSTVPTKADVDGLLACRAKAWNDGSGAALASCLQTGSSAHRSDVAALTKAADTHVRYEGVAYRLAGAPKIRRTATGAEVEAAIERTAYTVHEIRAARRVAAQLSTVKLELVRVGGGWRVSAWRAL